MRKISIAIGICLLSASVVTMLIQIGRYPRDAYSYFAGHLWLLLGLVFGFSWTAFMAVKKAYAALMERRWGRNKSGTSD